MSCSWDRSNSRMLFKLIEPLGDWVDVTRPSGWLGVVGVIWGTGVELGPSETRWCGSVCVDEACLYSGSLASILSLSLEEVLLSSLSGCCGSDVVVWPYRLGACRLRVFFLIPPRPPRQLAGLELPRRAVPLLEGIVSRVWSLRVWTTVR